MKGRTKIGLILLAILSLIGEFSIAAPVHQEVWWERIPGFFALLGFFGCLFLLFFAKAMGKILLRKREDYYDRR